MKSKKKANEKLNKLKIICIVKTVCDLRLGSFETWVKIIIYLETHTFKLEKNLTSQYLYTLYLNNYTFLFQN